jgi:hypothetical protein
VDRAGALSNERRFCIGSTVPTTSSAAIATTATASTSGIRPIRHRRTSLGACAASGRKTGNGNGGVTACQLGILATPIARSRPAGSGWMGGSPGTPDGMSGISSASSAAMESATYGR